MIVELTSDLRRIYKVLKDPEIFDRVAEEGIDKDQYRAPLDGAFYVMDKDNIGLMIYHWQNQITMECHIHVLKGYRHLAMEFGKAALDFAWHNFDVEKIVAQIPEIFPDVVGFAEKQGFVREGINRASYIKNGRIYHQYYMGLTRGE